MFSMDINLNEGFIDELTHHTLTYMVSPLTKERMYGMGLSI